MSNLRNMKRTTRVCTFAIMFGGGSDKTKLQNPISSDMSHMRPSLLPGLLQAVNRNQARGILNMSLFEIGPVFHGGEPDDQELIAASLGEGIQMAPSGKYEKHMKI